jgi:ribosomal protein S18 acetylase RimI-like enzyme
MIVRPALLTDAGAIAAIHVHSWQKAYQDILPPALLASLSIEQRAEMWRQNLERKASDTWVADEGGTVVGWISAAQSRDSDALSSTGEVWAIYVDPPYWRRGVGRLLWQHAKTQLINSGFVDVTLWVLKDNTQAIAFYEALGCVLDPGSEKTITLGGVELPEVRFRNRLDG